MGSERLIMARNSKLSNRNFEIRRATLRDLDALVHHRRGMWEDMGVGTKIELDLSDSAYRKWARTRLKSRRLLAWVAENGVGDIIGGGTLWLRASQPRPGFPMQLQPYLLSMYTEPDFRGIGVASRIVIEAVKWSKRKGYPSLLLHASNAGRRLYRRFGFKLTWEMSLRLETSA